MGKSWEQTILDTMTSAASSAAVPGVSVAVIKATDPMVVAYHGMDYPASRLLLAERLVTYDWKTPIVWDNPVLHDDKNHGQPVAKLTHKPTLKPGDKVFIVQSQDKQKLYVLDKVVSP